MDATTSPARAGNFYSGAGLDRADHLRRDADWLAARVAEDSSWFVPVWRNQVLIQTGAEPRALWLRGAELGDLRPPPSETVFLGRSGEAAVFAFDLSALKDPETAPAIVGRAGFEDLRAVGPLLARQDGAILAYARGVLIWHSRHRFCGVCGTQTESRQGGHLRACTAATCGTGHFPRTDPAVIMLVHDGDRCVLGRQAVWPQGMHSTLAGFVEPGESLEEAVAREVHEEVGIHVREVSYHSSQPWPFPSSIMLGFHAEARHGPLEINPHELADARWFTRQELRALPENDTLRLPRRDSIARRLVEDWLAG